MSNKLITTTDLPKTLDVILLSPMCYNGGKPLPPAHPINKVVAKSGQSDDTIRLYEYLPLFLPAHDGKGGFKIAMTKTRKPDQYLVKVYIVLNDEAFNSRAIKNLLAASTQDNDQLGTTRLQAQTVYNLQFTNFTCNGEEFPLSISSTQNQLDSTAGHQQAIVTLLMSKDDADFVLKNAEGIVVKCQYDAQIVTFETNYTTITAKQVAGTKYSDSLKGEAPGKMVQRKDVRLMLAKMGWSIAVKQVIDRPDVSNKLLSGLVEKFMNIIDKESEVLLQSSQAYIAKEKLSKEDYEPDVIELQVDKTKNEHHYSHDTDHHSNVDADVKAFWGALDGKAKTDVTHKTNTTKDDVYETDKQLQGRKRYFNDLFLVSDILTLIEQQHQLDYEESYRTRQTDAHTHTITFENYDYSPEPTSEPEAPVKDADFVADINGTPLDMVWVEGGTFRMGGTDDEACDSEKPVHEVTLSGFYISRYPVTQAQYYAVMGSNPSHFGGSNRLPVDNVSWDNAQEFCRKLNAQTVEKGLPAGYRLLTEAEWEYGARGGQKSKGYKYAGSDELGDVAHFSVNSGGSTQIVGLKKPNELGLYDMSGNVWEWCQDWYGSYKAEAQANPHGPQSGNYRVLRGGSWGNLAVRCRLAARNFNTPAIHDIICGFRLALPSRA